MHLIWNPYAMLPAVTSIVAASLMVYALQRRSVPHSGLLAGMMAWTVVWCLAYALQLLSSTLGGKYYWLRIKEIGSSSLPILWFVMTLRYTGRRHWITPKLIAALSLIPLLGIFFLFTEWPAGLMVASKELIMKSDFEAIRVTGGPWFYVHVSYIYLLVLASLGMLMQKVYHLPSGYRTQPLLLLGILLIAAVWNILYEIALKYTLPVNPVFLIATVGQIVLAWAIFRYRLYDLVPIAQERVMESIPEVVIVLDRDRRVANVNAAGRQILELSLRRIIGRPASGVFADWPMLAQMVHQSGRAHQELALDNGTGPRYYEAEALPLSLGRLAAPAQIVILHDVTQRRLAEEKQRRLVKELQEALAEVRTLSGLLPICSWCGKVRDDAGYWHRLEAFIREHSEADFTHSICPSCMAKLTQEVDRQADSADPSEPK